jgi:basic membrane protein A
MMWLASGCVIAKHTDVINEVKKVRDKIVSGEVTIDDPAAA